MEALQKFVQDYFTRLNLKNMPDSVKNHYKKMMENKDYPNKDVKSWANSWDAANGKWKDLPTLNPLPAEYADIDLDELYKILLETFYNMSMHENKLDDDTKTFLNKYFNSGRIPTPTGQPGPNKPFSLPSMDPSDKASIEGFLTLLVDQNHSMLIRDPKNRSLLTFVSKSKNFENPDVKNAIYQVISDINYDGLNNENPQIRAAAEELQNNYNLNHIQEVVSKSVNDVLPTQQNIDDLKRNLPDIFNTLYKKKKTAEAFKQYEPGEKVISEKIDEALGKTDYTGKIKAENYIAPKYDEKLNVGQTVKKKLEDTYSDVLKKFITLHRANLTMQKTTPAIIKQFGKAKIKPSDGLETIIEKAKDVSEKLKGNEPFEAADHFDWMIKKLTDFQKNGKSHEIKTALHNRGQMEHLVESLIIDAVNEGKVNEAKTALEVLSIMQYGMFTSPVMEKFKDMEATFLGDKDLSFNKNPYIRGVLSALDWTLKKGGQLFGYGLTALANKTWRSHSNYLKNSTKLEGLRLAEDAKIASDRNTWQQEKAQLDANDDLMIQACQDMIDDSGISNGADFQAAQRQLADGKRIEPALRNARDQAELDFEPLRQEKELFERATKELPAKRVQISAKIGQIKAQLKTIPNPAPDQSLQAQFDILKSQLDKEQQQLDSVEQEITEIKRNHPEFVMAGPGGKQIWKSSYPKNGEYATKKYAFDTAKGNYDTQVNANAKLENNIAIYEEAVRNMGAAQAQKDKRAKLDRDWDNDHKNGYAELMALWMFLQTGQTKSIWHLKTSALQKKMDGGMMQQMFAQYRSNVVGF